MTATNTVTVNGSLVQVTDQLFTATSGTEVTTSTAYTSDVFSNYNCTQINGRIFADQAGTISFQVSDDGATWDTVNTHTVVANTALAFQDTPNGAVMRYKFANTGSGTTTAFRFSAYAIGLRSL